MQPSTTDPPSAFIFPPVVVERLAACSVLYLLAVICSLCVILTVIRTKSVRSQLLGAMLINLAVAVLIRAMTVVVRDIESDSRGGIENFGTVGCHVYHNGYNVSEAVINAAILIICLDTTFSFPQSLIVQDYCIGVYLGFCNHIFLCTLVLFIRWPECRKVGQWEFLLHLPKATWMGPWYNVHFDFPFYFNYSRFYLACSGFVARKVQTRLLGAKSCRLFWLQWFTYSWRGRLNCRYSATWSRCHLLHPEAITGLARHLSLGGL